jgi:hypothetical protein
MPALEEHSPFLHWMPFFEGVLKLLLLAFVVLLVVYILMRARNWALTHR